MGRKHEFVNVKGSERLAPTIALCRNCGLRQLVDANTGQAMKAVKYPDCDSFIVAKIMED